MFSPSVPCSESRSRFPLFDLSPNIASDSFRSAKEPSYSVTWFGGTLSQESTLQCGQIMKIDPRNLVMYVANLGYMMITITIQ